MHGEINKNWKAVMRERQRTERVMGEKMEKKDSPTLNSRQISTHLHHAPMTSEVRVFKWHELAALSLSFRMRLIALGLSKAQTSDINFS